MGVNLRVEFNNETSSYFVSTLAAMLSDYKVTICFCLKVGWALLWGGWGC